MLTNKAVAIVDPDIKSVVQQYQFNIDRIISPLTFTKKHRTWLSNDSFQCNGLEKFQNAYVTNGCTGAFNDAYKDTCFVLQGEYPYHRDTNCATEAIDFTELTPDSRLIISYPFARTGNPHKYWNEILEFCYLHRIKIFIDACLSGVSCGLLDLSHPAITHVAFSFSKAFGTGHARIGVLYSVDDAPSPAKITNNYLYINHNNAYLHYQLMDNFSSDYIFVKYKQKQLQICKERNLHTSDCVLFGLENDQRRCITRLLCNN
jgi:hypothetical protein